MSPKICLLFLALTVNHLFGQNQNYPIYFHVFDSDSLKGFDEMDARAKAIQENYTGAELKIKMYLQKREFINNKYNLAINKVLVPSYQYQPDTKHGVLYGCLNDDFETSVAATITNSGQISGWTVVGGSNCPFLPNSSSQTGYNPYFPQGLYGVTSCNLMGCCPMPPAHSAIIDCSVGYVDPTIGSQYPIYSIFGTGTVSGSSLVNPQINGGLYGTKVLRLNDEITNDYSVERLTKVLPVNAGSSFYQFAIIPVLAPGHLCCDAGSLQIRFRDFFSGNVLACPSLSVSGPSGACTATTVLNFYNGGDGSPYNPTTNYGNIYCPWKVYKVDLSPYLGQVLVLEVITTDCDAGGHFGCMYFDAQCGDLKININSIDYQALNSAINYTSCSDSVNLQAPVGFNTYQWNGPVGITSTKSALTTTVPGTYVLTLDQGLSCSVISKTVQISFSASVAAIFSSDSTLCQGESTQITAIGINNCHWSTGDSTQAIIVSPMATTQYSVNGFNQDGCQVSASITQSVEVCLGLASKFRDKAISIYPNPNHGNFTVTFSREASGGELLVLNAVGKIVYTQALGSGENIIRTKGLVPGIYYYKVQDAEKKTIAIGKLEIGQD